MIGKSVSHYRILEKLGAGGMGVVYKAEDTKLRRIVALKFLTPELTRDPEAKERFIQEAQAASSLDHPNVCTIYEIDETEDGQMFIAMAYYEGETVKEKIEQGPLKLEEAVDIAIQVTEGLQEAHKKGIVHRDIKSANITVVTRGQAKIMDFGLAKLAGQTKLTEAGTTLGTVAYMSPEQTHGGEVDHRTDIWSLGVVLYEMVTGQLPFKGKYEQAVMYSILNEDPEAITALRTGVPMELERIVNKALVKSLDSRYQNAGDILADLRLLRKELESIILKEPPSEGKPQPSIAVLPFTNLSADKEQEYFCDGMTEEIINALTHIEGLRVVARTSAFSFRGKEIDVREIGRKLSVETLLEGSVRKAGNRLRISAQLVNVVDGYHLWSERYDREMEDVFAVQDEISLAIADKLKVKLLSGEKTKLITHHTEDLEAYNLYLRGRYFWNKRTEGGIKKAIEYFKQAIKKDPSYALAYTGLADSYSTLTSYISILPKEVFPKGRDAALKALEIDDTLAEAHASLAIIKVNYEWDWAGAEREYRQAIKLNPNYASAHHWYSLYLMCMARFDEAIEEVKQALELDPFSLVINRHVGSVFYRARQYDQAIDALQKTIEMDPNFVYSHSLLGQVYLEKSMYKEALAEFKKEKALSKLDYEETESAIGITYVKIGERGKALQVLNDLIERRHQTYVKPTFLACMSFALGENDQGFKWLEKAYEERDCGLCYLKIFHEFDSVRSDSRFSALLKKMGLEK